MHLSKDKAAPDGLAKTPSARRNKLLTGHSDVGSPRLPHGREFLDCDENDYAVVDETRFGQHRWTSSVINRLLISSRGVSLIISSRVETRTDARIDSVILVERIGVASSSRKVTHADVRCVRKRL
jgi:hypothetical protein